MPFTYRAWLLDQSHIGFKGSASLQSLDRSPISDILGGAALPTRSRRCDRFLHTSRGVLGKRANCVKKAKLIEMA